MFKILKNKNLIKNKEQEEKLIKYYYFLKEWNEKFNLTSIKEEKEVEIKHFEDSIKGESLFPKNSNVVEIGSGAGFPSIPLMIVRNDLTFTLVESVGKKCEFLKFIIKELNLKATVINKRAEELGKEKKYRESFDVVTARAVASMQTLSEYALPLIKKEGLFIAYKGINDEIKLAKNALKILGGEYEKGYYYSLSENMGERIIYVIKKIEKTPEKYPRGNGKERSKPL